MEMHCTYYYIRKIRLLQIIYKRLKFSNNTLLIRVCAFVELRCFFLYYTSTKKFKE